MLEYTCNLSDLNEKAYYYGMPPRVIDMWAVADNPERRGAFCAVIVGMAEFTEAAQARAAGLDEDADAEPEPPTTLPTAGEGVLNIGRIVLREPALGDDWERLFVALRKWRLQVNGGRGRARIQRRRRRTNARRHAHQRHVRARRSRIRENGLESERLGDTLERVQVEQAVEVTAMNDERMGGGTGGPTTTAPAAEDGGEGRYGGDGSGPDPTAERRVPRNHPGRAETQSEGESSDEDDELSSDGERGGDEYANEFCEMPADFDEWGGPGYDLDASGGGGYD